MKTYNSVLKMLVVMVVVAAGTFGCVGDKTSQLDIVNPASGARVKFIHAVPDAPGVSILVNNKQFSGVLTSPPAAPGIVTYGTTFPVNDYAVLDAGTAKVDVVTPASGTIAQATVISGSVPVEANKFYSVFAIGSVAGGGLEAFITEDNLTPADTAKAYIRLVNTIANTTTGYDLGSGTTYPSALANVGYKKATAFVAVDPVPTGGNPIPVLLRLNGTTVNLAPTTFTFSPIKRRFYTFYLRGRVGGTGTQVLTITSYTNR
jgi:hypothetical protein